MRRSAPFRPIWPLSPRYPAVIDPLCTTLDTPGPPLATGVLPRGSPKSLWSLGFLRERDKPLAPGPRETVRNRSRARRFEKVGPVRPRQSTLRGVRVRLISGRLTTCGASSPRAKNRRSP